MLRLPPVSTRTDTLFPDTTVVRSPGRADFGPRHGFQVARRADGGERRINRIKQAVGGAFERHIALLHTRTQQRLGHLRLDIGRSEEHTSELQSLIRISYAVCCLQEKNRLKTQNETVVTRHTL